MPTLQREVEQSIGPVDTLAVPSSKISRVGATDKRTHGESEKHRQYLKSDCDKLKINEVKIDGTDRKMRQANKIF